MKFRLLKQQIRLLAALFAAGFVASFAFSGAIADTSLPVSLEEWSFTEQGSFRLKNDWTVYRNAIVLPDAFGADACMIAPSARGDAIQEHITTPDLWGPGFTTNIETGHGTATYCREIVLPSADVFYALRMGTMRSVSHIYAVYIDARGAKNTALLFENGSLDPAVEQVVSNPAIPNIVLPYGVQRLTFVMQLSNRIHKQGGMVEVPLLDLKWRLDAAENRATALPSALVICLLMVAIAAYIWGGRSSNTVDHRLFSLMAAVAAFRAAFVSDLVWDYFPDFDLARKYDMEYLSLYAIAIAYYAFVNQLLRPGKNLKIDYVIYGLSAGLIFFAIFLAPFFAPGTITLTREPIQIIWASIVMMVVFSVFYTSVKSPERRREAIVVSLAALTYATYEILSVVGVIASSLEWSQFIIFVVIMMHAQAFVIKARRTEQERDILLSDLQEANRDLQNRALALDLALKRAEAASTAKSNFLANFSHELRSPLNAIIGFSDMMGNEVMGPIGNATYKGYAFDIHSSGTHLLALVDEILDLSRIEAGATDLLEQKVDVAELIKGTLSLLQLQAEQKNIEMSVEQLVDLPILLGDTRRIKQVMINLITNAIKYNKENGAIKVSLHADETGLYIEILDTGVGIAAEEIPIVLTRFGQAESAKKKHNSGVGIGLPLSEVLVRQHEGTLKLTSKLGEGTCIHIWFPSKRLLREEEVA